MTGRSRRIDRKFATRRIIVTLGASLVLGACGAAATSPVDRATNFWEAVESGDRDAAMAEVDTTALASGDGNVFGRASTLEDQFDWYEAVDWEWTLGECVEGDADTVECTATARNAWSDALAVEPITGTFEMEIGETGIVRIDDQSDSFISQWSPQVFEVFAAWVTANHPEEAETMFDFSVDVNPEILQLYRVNSDRFVEAHGG